MPTSNGIGLGGQVGLELPAVGDLGDGVDADGLQGLQLARRLAEGVRRGQPALVHRGRRQRREADHVADGVDVRHLGGVAAVDLQPPARGRRVTPARSRFSRSVLPWRPAEYMTISAATFLPEASVVIVPRPGALHRRHLLAEPEGHGVVAQVELERLDDLGIAEVEHLGALLDQRHPGAQGGEHRGVLDADHAGPDHHHGVGHLLQLEDLVGVEHPRAVELDVGRSRRQRAGGDDDLVSGQGAVQLLPLDVDRQRVRVDEAAIPGISSMWLRSSWDRITSVSRPITCCSRASRSAMVISSLTR